LVAPGPLVTRKVTGLPLPPPVAASVRVSPSAAADGLALVVAVGDQRDEAYQRVGEEDEERRRRGHGVRRVAGTGGGIEAFEEH